MRDVLLPPEAPTAAQTGKLVSLVAMAAGSSHQAVAVAGDGVVRMVALTMTVQCLQLRITPQIAN